MNDTTKNNSVNLEDLETDLNELVENTESSTVTEVPSDVSNTQIFLVLPTQDKTDPQEDAADLINQGEETTVLKSVEVTKQRVSAEDATGLKASVLSLIGDYETVVTDYTYQNGSYVSHTIDVQPDLAWCTSALLFLAVLWSCLKMFSIALRGNHRR